MPRNIVLINPYSGLRRMVRAKTVLGIDGYYSETKTETFMSILAGALLGYRLLKVSPVRLGNKFTKGSYPPEITPEGLKFKWSKPRSSITISPVSSRAKKLLVNMHSIADKQMTIKANNVITKRYLVTHSFSFMDKEICAWKK